MNKISGFRGEYFLYSNFYLRNVIYAGIRFLCNESAFQAMKCEDYEQREKFSNLDPSHAKRKGGRHGDIRLRSDWEQVKDQIMYEIVKEKFLQNKDLKKKLEETGDAYLEEENNWGDDYWGTVNGKGKNKLGKILMRVREELSNVN